MRLAIGILLATAWLSAAPQRRGVPESGIRLTSSRVTRIPPPGLLTVRLHVETESDFLTTDPFAYYLVTYNGGRTGDKIRVEWHNPLDAIVQQATHVQVTGGGPIRLASKLLIAGSPAAFTPGDWQVRLFYNDQGVAVADFKISNPPDSIVNMASRTLLPEATVAVPYYYQLTARGGTPPYQWSAVKPLPPGLALSPSGTISGSPEERGSFRTALEAKDSAGNSVVRTFGMAVGAISANAHSNARVLLEAAVASPCSQTASRADFPASDPTVVLAASLEAPGGREGRVEWLNPRGELYQTNRITMSAERQECVVETLPLAGHRAATEPGDWRVRLLWNDLEIFTLKFTVSAAKTAAAGGRTGGTPVAARSGRLAILIGNRRYDKLPAPGPDAADLDLLESALRQDGFEIVRKADANLENLRLIEHTLEEKLQAGDTVVIYYAGFDARSGGDDWLLPVNYEPADSRPMQSKAYSVLRLMQVLEDSKAALKFIFLDAAAVAGQPRENPGEVMGEVDESTALIYSSPPGAAPKPGAEAPGVFARALAEVLAKPGLDARTALQVELPKSVARLAPTVPQPVAILGGGADFVFRTATASRGR